MVDWPVQGESTSQCYTCVLIESRWLSLGWSCWVPFNSWTVSKPFGRYTISAPPHCYHDHVVSSTHDTFLVLRLCSCGRCRVLEVDHFGCPPVGRLLSTVTLVAMGDIVLSFQLTLECAFWWLWLRCQGPNSVQRKPVELKWHVLSGLYLYAWTYSGYLLVQQLSYLTVRAIVHVC